MADLSKRVGRGLQPALEADVPAVDVALVLAADASGSISQERLALQFEGHARALESAEVIEAIRSGPQGQIALTFVAWTGANRQVQLVDWSIIADAAAARAFAAALRRAPGPVPGYTSISGAIDGAARLLARSGILATRQVIDVCGNGTNNDGPPVTAARDAAVAAGITVNGLPILDLVAGLDTYFAEHVVGGPRAFLSVASDPSDLTRAVLRKLLLEIASVPHGIA